MQGAKILSDWLLLDGTLRYYKIYHNSDTNASLSYAQLQPSCHIRRTVLKQACKAALLYKYG